MSFFGAFFVDGFAVFFVAGFAVFFAFAISYLLVMHPSIYRESGTRLSMRDTIVLVGIELPI